MATHSSILAWRIPWTEEPGGLQSMGLQRVGHDMKQLSTYICIFLHKVIYRTNSKGREFFKVRWRVDMR